MRRLMGALSVVFLLTLGSLTVSGSAVAAEPEEIMGDATDVLNKFVDIPEGGMSNALLRKAYGIAVIPSVLRIGFIGGINYGQGVLSVRTEDGHWSKPVFLKTYGGSVGFQAGASSTDMVLVFKTKRSVRRLANGDFTLGGDASVAAGPVGRSTSAGTSWNFDSEVYSYARARGLFAGAAFNGARLSIAKDSNQKFYDDRYVSVEKLLDTDAGDGSSLPQPGQDFIQLLDKYMPSSDRYYDSEGGDRKDDLPEDDTAADGAADEDSEDDNEAAEQDNGQSSAYQSRGDSITVEEDDPDETADDDEATEASGDRPDEAADDADEAPSRDNDRGAADDDQVWARDHEDEPEDREASQSEDAEQDMVPDSEDDESAASGAENEAGDAGASVPEEDDSRPDDAGSESAQENADDDVWDYGASGDD